MSVLLICGLSTDGPSDEYQIESYADLINKFGGEYIESFNLPPSVSSLNLSYNAYGYLFNNSWNGIANYLFQPQASGNIITFGSMGVSGTVLVDYTPYLGKSDLLCASKNYIQKANDFPKVQRVGGVNSSFISSDWNIKSIYGGAKYNKLTITCTASSFTVGGLEPNWGTLTYTGTTGWEIFNQVENDYQNKLSPIRIINYPYNLYNLTVGLTGGIDGSMDLPTLTNFFQNLSPGIDVTHILLLTPVTSDIINLINNYYVDNTIQLRIFGMPTTGFYTPTLQFVQDQYTNLPQRHNSLMLFTGDTNVVIDSFEVSRHFAEAAMVSLVSNQAQNLTNLPINAQDFQPLLNSNDLDLMVYSGFMSPMRYIGNDISVYKGIMSTGVDKPALVNVYAEVCSLGSLYFEPYLGLPIEDGNHANMALGLQNALQDALDFIIILQTTVVSSGGTLYASVVADYYDEILTISFSIKNN